MAQSFFNLNTFLQEYKSYNNKAYTAVENGRTEMEERAIERAEEAVKDSGFLTLTLSEKLAELGLGDRVLKQIGDTALNLLKEFVNPITDYLENYENIFDQTRYNAEIQSYAKQMFYANQALTEDAQSRTDGQHFVLDV